MTLETQLWLWLEECDDRKPRPGTAVLEGHDKAVRLLQVRDREGREAREAGVVDGGFSSNLQ